MLHTTQNKAWQILTILLLYLSSMTLPLRAASTSSVSLDASNQEVREVIASLAKQADINVVIDESVQSRVSLKLASLPFSSALEAIASTCNLSVEEVNGIFVIKPKIRTSTYEETESAYIIDTSEYGETNLIEIISGMSPRVKIQTYSSVVVVRGPYTDINNIRAALSEWFSRAVRTSLDNQETKVIKILNTEAQHLASAISGIYSGLRVTCIESLNSLIVSGRQNDVASLTALIQEIDKPQKTLRVDVAFFEVSHGTMADIGIDWRGELGIPGVSFMLSEREPQFTPYYSSEVMPGNEVELRPVVRSSIDISATLRMLAQSGKARLLTNPTIMAVENRTSTIETRERYSITVTTTQGGRPSQQTQYVDSGIRLELNARIDRDGLVVAAIRPEVNVISGFSSDGSPKVSTHTIQTVIKAVDGEPVILGGLMEVREYEAESGLPIIGKIPVIGRLFSTETKSKETSELIIVVCFKLM